MYFEGARIGLLTGLLFCICCNMRMTVISMIVNVRRLVNVILMLSVVTGFKFRAASL